MFPCVSEVPGVCECVSVHVCVYLACRTCPVGTGRCAEWQRQQPENAAHEETPESSEESCDPAPAEERGRGYCKCKSIKNHTTKRNNTHSVKRGKDVRDAGQNKDKTIRG